MKNSAEESPNSNGSAGGGGENASAEIFSVSELAIFCKTNPPTAEQEEIISAPPTQILVIAGAGSGKTETIANRLVYCVVNGAIPPENILGLTFTRKAAGEMSARFAKRLESLAQTMEDALGGEAQLKKYRERFQELARRGITPEVLRRPAASSTYDSYAQSLLGEYGCLIGREVGYTTITDAARFQIMSQVVSAYRGPLIEKAQGERPATLVSDLLQLASEANAHLVDLENLKDFYANALAKAMHIRQTEWDDLRGDAKKELRAIIVNMRFGINAVGVLRAFNERKQEMLVADFSDQTRQAVDLVKRHPQVGISQRARYRLVFLDEFQDTSVAQMKYLAALFKGHSVTAVGDPNQSIYGWRGASAAAMEDFATFFCDNLEDLYTLNLSTSWRNDRLILQAANRLSNEVSHAPRPGRLRENLWEIDPGSLLVNPLVERPGAKDGVVLSARTKTDVEQAKVLVAFFQEWLAQRQAILHASKKNSQPDDLGQGQARTVELPTAAVLCRKKSDIPAITRAFDAAGIPYQTKGAQGILNDAGVALVRAAMSLCVNPEDSASLMVLLDRYRIGLSDLKALGQNRHGLTPYQALMENQGEVSSKARMRLESVRELILKLRENAAFASPLVLARLAHRLLGLDIEQQIPGTAIDPASFAEFLSMIRDFQRTPGATVSDFLSWLDVGESEEANFGDIESEPDDSSVQILTMHTAKGLEWDYVALPNLNQGSFPDDKTDMWLKKRSILPYPLRSDRAHLPDYRLETLAREGKNGKLMKKIILEQYKEDRQLHSLKEESRLAYVAFTRAKSHLLLCSCCFERQTKSLRFPSPFFLIAQSPHNHIFSDFCQLCVDKVLNSDGAYEASAQDSLVTWMEGEGLPDTRVGRGDKKEVNPNQESFDGGLWPAPAAMETNEELRRSVVSVESVPPLPPDFPSPLAKHLRRLLEAPRPELTGEGLLGRVSATSIAKLGGDGEAFLLQRIRPLPQEPSNQARLGSLMHAWIASQLDADTLDIDSGVPTRLSQAQQQRLDAWKQHYGNLSFLSDMRPLDVETSGELLVGKENPVVIPLRIDAVFQNLRDNKIWILDWKTGAKPKPEDYLSWVHQLGIYRLYWCQTHSEVSPQDVKCAYVFLGQERLRERRLSLDTICESLGWEDYTMELLGRELERAQEEANNFLSEL